MRRNFWWTGCFACVTAAAAAVTPDAPPVPAVRPVEATHFGTTVVDPYRWMEATDTAEFRDYVAAQNDYTRRTFARLAAPRAALLARIKALQRGTAKVRFVALGRDAYTWLETPVGATRAQLMRRAPAGGTPRVLLDPARFDTKAQRASIDFYSESKDGRRIALAVAHGGGEDWTFRVFDATRATLLPDTLADVAEPFAHFSADGSAVYYSRLQTLPPGAPESAKLDGIRVYRHVLGTPQARDTAVFGAGVVDGIALEGQVFPGAYETDDGRHLVAWASRGTEVARAWWIRDRAPADAPWRRIADFGDTLTALALHGDRACAIQQSTSNGQLVCFDAVQDGASHAQVVLERSDVVLAAENGELAGARDALYAAGQRNGRSVVFRMAWTKDATPQELELPATGELIEFGADHAVDGFVYALQSQTLSPRVFRYDPQRNASADTGIYRADPADFSGIETRDVDIDSSEGARVTLTITRRKDLALDGTHPLLLTVYGAYGSVVPRWFSAPDLAWYERGGIIAHVHARGGGERGEAWHLAATKTHKQRTVDDVIAAARWLVKEKYTSPEHLALAGKSAGGIPAGAALVQQPALFGAVLLRVGVVDLMRFEQSALGPANTQEFGSVSNEDEFRALHALSPYANVRDGTAYPAVLLETGINDPRVPSWQLAKMAARLQAASTSQRPVLLRVDYAAGHGLGSDQDQIAELLADEYTFLGWQLGMPDVKPGDAGPR